jgi:hypothetical protein
MPKGTSFDEDRNAVDVLDVLASALVPRLIPRLREALESDNSKLMTADDTPTPRAVKEACRDGLIRDARLVHRRWMFPAEAWAEYVASRGTPPRRTPDRSRRRQAPAPDEDAVLDELRRELGFARRMPSARTPNDQEKNTCESSEPPTTKTTPRG